MKRIIAHWAVTRYKATATSRRHYHMVVEGDGSLVEGTHAPEANRRIVGRKYAAHTRNLNTGSIGISMASMAGAKWPDDAGAYPFTEVQFNAMCRQIAAWCKKYGIVVSPSTVLSHAEVEPTLGVKQSGKWDFTIIPFMPSVKGARACGDEMRRRVSQYMGGVDVAANDGPSSEGLERTRWLQRLLSNLGYDLGVPDGVVGPKTEAAILRFQQAVGVEQSGEFDTQTVAALRADLKSAPIKADAVSVERALRKDGSRTIEGADMSKETIFQRLIALTGGSVGSVFAFIQGLDWRLVALVIIVALAWYVWNEIKAFKAARSTIAARVDDAVTGKNTARLEALERAGVGDVS